MFSTWHAERKQQQQTYLYTCDVAQLSRFHMQTNQTGYNKNSKRKTSITLCLNCPFSDNTHPLTPTKPPTPTASPPLAALWSKQLASGGNARCVQKQLITTSRQATGLEHTARGLSFALGFFSYHTAGQHSAPLFASCCSRCSCSRYSFLRSCSHSHFDHVSTHSAGKDSD